MIGHAYDILLVGAMIVLGILIIVSIVRSVLGPGISDRVIAVNMIGTIIIMVIAILSVYLDEGYLVDVCLIYAMISFLGVVVLCKVYTGVYLQRKHMKANLEAVEDNLQHQEEAGEGDLQQRERTAGNDPQHPEATMEDGLQHREETVEDNSQHADETVGNDLRHPEKVQASVNSGAGGVGGAAEDGNSADPAGITKAENERPQKEAR